MLPVAVVRYGAIKHLNNTFTTHSLHNAQVLLGSSLATWGCCHTNDQSWIEFNYYLCRTQMLNNVDTHMRKLGYLVTLA